MFRILNQMAKHKRTAEQAGLDFKHMKEAQSQKKAKVDRVILKVKPGTVAKFTSQTAAETRYPETPQGNAELVYNVLIGGYGLLNKMQQKRVGRLLLDIVTLTHTHLNPTTEFTKGAKLQISNEGWQRLFHVSEKKPEKPEDATYGRSGTAQWMDHLKIKMDAPWNVVTAAIQCHINWVQDLKAMKRAWGKKFEALDLLAKRKAQKESGDAKKKITTGIRKIRDIYTGLRANKETFVPNCINEAYALYGSAKRVYPTDAKTLEALAGTNEQIAFVDTSILPPSIFEDNVAKFAPGEFTVTDVVAQEAAHGAVALGTSLAIPATIPREIVDEKNMPIDITGPGFKNLVDLDENITVNLIAPKDMAAQAEVKAQGIKHLGEVSSEAAKVGKEFEDSKNPLLQLISENAKELAEQAKDTQIINTDKLQNEYKVKMVPNNLHEAINVQINNKAQEEKKKEILTEDDIFNDLELTPEFKKALEGPPLGVIPPMTMEQKKESFGVPVTAPPIPAPVPVAVLPNAIPAGAPPVNNVPAQCLLERTALSIIKSIACAPTPAQGQLQGIKAFFGCT